MLKDEVDLIFWLDRKPALILQSPFDCRSLEPYPALLIPQPANMVPNKLAPNVTNVLNLLLCFILNCFTNSF